MTGKIAWSREQSTGETLVAARYAVITANENRVTVVARHGNFGAGFHVVPVE
jgi:hypothetical protein